MDLSPLPPPLELIIHPVSHPLVMGLLSLPIPPGVDKSVSQVSQSAPIAAVMLVPWPSTIRPYTAQRSASDSPVSPISMPHQFVFEKSSLVAVCIQTFKCAIILSRVSICQRPWGSPAESHLVHALCYPPPHNVQLNGYLKRFNIKNNATCLGCGEAKEAVRHYLLVCPKYEDQRDKMRKAVGVGGMKMEKLPRDHRRVKKHGRIYRKHRPI
jgi:hypothetical protein